MMESAIYFGTLRHRRFHPRRHEFTYPLFMAYLDVDRIAGVDASVTSGQPQPLELGQL